MSEILEVIGVGPHPQPWPTDKQYDPELLAGGDRRNVEDRYRYWTIEAIKADLDKSRVDLHIAIENWQHDMNIGTIVRNANAFNVAAVHIIGKRHWNRRGAMVTDRYLHIEQYQTVADFVAAMRGRHIIAVDNLEGAVPLSGAALPK
jgi:tRNA G18 (ribose-2'-O)-methylase SpoU